MLLEEAIPKLKPFINIPFKEFFTYEDLKDLTTDKGIVGKILERTLGLKNTSNLLDFENGELKTNKSRIDGTPRETMAITQISSNIDNILNKQPFENSHLFHKIKNLLYVPICKDGNKLNWRLLPFIHVNLCQPQYSNLLLQIEQDYYSIIDQLLFDIENKSDGYIHTSNGQFIQIRSKDSKPYNPIFSKTFNKNISNKNHAFYFKKDFMLYLQSLSPNYPII